MYYALIRKDLRILRPAIITAILVALLLEGVLPAISYYLSRRDMLRGRAWTLPSDAMWRTVAEAGVPAFVISLGFAAVFGGASITIERRERWGEFAAMLPISRLRRTLVTLSVGVLLFAATFAFHALLITYASERAGRVLLSQKDDMLWAVGFLSIGLFGLAWLTSAFVRSPTIAAAISIGTVLGGLIAAYMLPAFVDPSTSGGPGFTSPSWSPERVARIYRAAIAVVGALAIVAGTIYSARRAEP